MGRSWNVAGNVIYCRFTFVKMSLVVVWSIIINTKAGRLIINQRATICDTTNATVYGFWITPILGLKLGHFCATSTYPLES